MRPRPTRRLLHSCSSACLRYEIGRQMRQRFNYTRGFRKVKPQNACFCRKRQRADEGGGLTPSARAPQRISETMLSTAWSTATPSLWILFPTCVFMGSLPQGSIIPATAPATIPAPIPGPKSDTHLHIQSLLCGLGVVWLHFREKTPRCHLPKTVRARIIDTKLCQTGGKPERRDLDHDHHLSDPPCGGGGQSVPHRPGPGQQHPHGPGLAAGRALSRRFADIPVDAVYASDLYRTCATASAIYRPKGLPLHRGGICGRSAWASGRRRPGVRSPGGTRSSWKTSPTACICGTPPGRRPPGRSRRGCWPRCGTSRQPAGKDRRRVLPGCAIRLAAGGPPRHPSGGAGQNAHRHQHAASPCSGWRGDRIEVVVPGRRFPSDGPGLHAGTRHRPAGQRPGAGAVLWSPCSRTDAPCRPTGPDGLRSCPPGPPR